MTVEILGNVILKRETGLYDDVIDAASYLKSHDYVSAANAIAVMVRKSPLFTETIEAIERERREQ